MKLRTFFAVAILSTALPVFAGTPAASAAMKTLAPCAQTKAGCPKAMAVPRNDDPGIMPSESKKTNVVRAARSAEVKKTNVTPILKNEKAAPAR